MQGHFPAAVLGHSLGNAEKVLRGGCAKYTNTNPEIRGDASRWTPCMRDCRRNYVGNKLRNPRTKVKNRGSSRTKQLVVMICCWSSFHIQYLCRHRRPPRETGHEEAASKLCCIDVKSFPLLYITEARSSPLPPSSSEVSLCAGVCGLRFRHF